MNSFYLSDRPISVVLLYSITLPLVPKHCVLTQQISWTWLAKINCMSDLSADQYLSFFLTVTKRMKQNENILSASSLSNECHDHGVSL